MPIEVDTSSDPDWNKYPDNPPGAGVGNDFVRTISILNILFRTNAPITRPDPDITITPGRWHRSYFCSDGFCSEHPVWNKCSYYPTEPSIRKGPARTCPMPVLVMRHAPNPPIPQHR